MRGIIDGTETEQNIKECQSLLELKENLKHMAHIRLRKDGRYEGIICFRGKYYSVYERNLNKIKPKINKKLKELKQQNLLPTISNYTKNSPTLSFWYETWLENDKKPFIGKKTLQMIENIFHNHILPKLGNVRLLDLDKTKIQTFLNGMQKSRIKEMTSNYFKACITQAFKERLIEYNPFDTVKFDKKIKSDKVGFTAYEQQQILEYLKENDLRVYKIILLYLCTGCRRSELKTIKLENIQNDYLLIQGTKTENAVRYLNVSPALKDFITNNIEMIQSFPEHYIAKKFREVLNHLQIKGTIHSLRHSFATNHYFLGTNAKLLQEWMGHSTINITLDIYTNVNPTINRTTEKNLIKKVYNNLYYYTSEI